MRLGDPRHADHGGAGTRWERFRTALFIAAFLVFPWTGVILAIDLLADGHVNLGGYAAFFGRWGLALATVAVVAGFGLQGLLVTARRSRTGRRNDPGVPAERAARLDP
jgi:hypothetical protein